MINRKSARLPKWYGPSPDLPARSLGSASAKAGGFGPQGRGQADGWLWLWADVHRLSEWHPLYPRKQT